MATPIDFECPECEAAPGVMCVYRAPEPAMPGYSVDPVRAARTGKPTKRFHNGRWQTLYEWEQRAERLAMLEYLQWWLQEFGDIFQETS